MLPGCEVEDHIVHCASLPRNVHVQLPPAPLVPLLVHLHSDGQPVQDPGKGAPEQQAYHAAGPPQLVDGVVVQAQTDALVPTLVPDEKDREGSDEVLSFLIGV